MRRVLVDCWYSNSRVYVHIGSNANSQVLSSASLRIYGSLSYTIYILPRVPQRISSLVLPKNENFSSSLQKLLKIISWLCVARLRNCHQPYWTFFFDLSSILAAFEFFRVFNSFVSSIVFHGCTSDVPKIRYIRPPSNATVATMKKIFCH